ncbi:FAS1 domain-containing protein [Teratosphaeria nubilosa]|uniref:FAS1 domain-containing protein n=1 Tax=Teratosphaeria nubilosa TaxID=161662 RepID=A0A6G1LNF0_9PEZI|nr:FAS1 domain-containing protein [Teratosphaeria nubilosa]
MKFSSVLPLAALSTAFVIPSEEVLGEVAIEKHHRPEKGWYEKGVEEKDKIISSFQKHYDEVTDTASSAWHQVYESSKSALDEALESASEAGETANKKIHDAAFDVESFFRTEGEDFYDSFDEHEGLPHDGPPRDGPPHHGPPRDGPPHRKPHHPPHHGPPNETVYELISKSKYTTKLATLISKYPDLVETLNSTKANYTVFAPTDKAFEKIPDHAPEPSKEQLKLLLEYHVVDGFYPAGRVLASHTAPTLLQGEHLASEPKPQRVAFKISLRGLTANFYSRIIAIDIFATNGVIHGVDSIILPPPTAIKIIDLLPGEFSTLELGLAKTGLLEKLNTTEHAGGTLFAPSNFAFQKLGPKINAFLFSTYGQKYLKALLEYHVVPGNTLYSDAYYKAKESEDPIDYRIPKGLLHVDLPTLLKDRNLAVDVARYGRFIEIKINAFSRVTVSDGIAEDGVIHVVSNVIIPPKNVGGPDSDEAQHWEGEELSVEELVERLEPFVAKGDL